MRCLKIISNFHKAVHTDQPITLVSRGCGATTYISTVISDNDTPHMICPITAKGAAYELQKITNDSRLLVKQTESFLPHTCPYNSGRFLRFTRW